MNPDIVITRDKVGYHLMHGLLHLAVAIDLSDSRTTYVDVKGHGAIQIGRSNEGFAVQSADGQKPLLIY